jgi:hypothetical protein
MLIYTTLWCPASYGLALPVVIFPGPGNFRLLCPNVPRTVRIFAECIGRAISDANSGVGEFARHVLADAPAHKL